MKNCRTARALLTVLVPAYRPLLLRRACSRPLCGLGWTVVMGLFSRRKIPAPARPRNPFVPTPEHEVARRGRVAAGSTLSEGLIPFYEARRGGRPTVEHPRTKRVSLSLAEQEHESLVAVAKDTPDPPPM